MPKPERVSNVVVISDLHVGCQMGLCPPSGLPMAGGGLHVPGISQEFTWECWKEFWNKFVPEATRGEPFVLVCNGDALDGRHHGATTQWTQNFKDQIEGAYQILKPVVKRAASYYHINGTEAHVGPSAEMEAELAKRLGVESRWELRLRLGNRRIHFTHHISTSSSPYAESTALQRELVNSYLEAGRWGDKPYSMIVRSHRHQQFEVSWKAKHGKVTGTITPAWQLKTPFTYKIGARIQQPQIGGLVIRLADDELFVRAYVERPDPPQEVVV